MESILDTKSCFDKISVESCIRDIEEILSTGILQDLKSHTHPLKRPAFISVLIQLRHLMAISEEYGHRIDFKDDVIPSHLGTRSAVEDVTGLIRYVRDAICHPEAQKNFLNDSTKVTFSTVHGKLDRPMFCIEGEPVGPTFDYEDDVAFCFGPQRIYLNRHIIRALEEAKKSLLPIVNKPGFEFKDKEAAKQFYA